MKTFKNTSELRANKVDRSIFIPFIILAVLAIAFLFSSCSTRDNGAVKMNRPAVYTETVYEDGEMIVNHTVKFIITEIKADTIYKPLRVNGTTVSTLEDYNLKEIHQNSKKVDLNDYLGFIDKDTDWNYTEGDDYTDSILAANGIYLDRVSGEWRKR